MATKSTQPLATDDTHYDMMASDPTITQFPAGSVFGSAPPAITQPTAVLTSAGNNSAVGAEILILADDKFGKFINSKWRPLFAMMYLMTCICDFTLFPILWSVMQALNHGNVATQWQPLTLQGAGLFHLACGAVLGVAAYGRTQEKIAGKS
jgi:hypothetical protein